MWQPRCGENKRLAELGQDALTLKDKGGLVYLVTPAPPSLPGLQSRLFLYTFTVLTMANSAIPTRQADSDLKSGNVREA